MSDTRPGWDQYFLGIAEAVAARADCTRRQYGCVIVKAHRIVSTGYNGAPSGRPGCLSGACPRGHLSYDALPPGSSYDTGPGACISLHAELNACVYAGRDRTEGATLYLNQGSPCDGCMRVIHAAGIIRIVTPFATMDL